MRRRRLARTSYEAAQAFLIARQAAGRFGPISNALAQQNWYIDADNGNDNNSGIGGFQNGFRTWAKYISLTGYEEVFNGRSVDVWCRGTFPDSDPIMKRAIGAGLNYHFGVHGTQGVLLSTNLTSFTASVPSSGGGGTRAQFSVASGLTPAMIGALCFFPNSGVYTYITTVSGQTATCLDPTDASNVVFGPVPTRRTPSNTEPIVISRGTSALTLLLEWIATSVGPSGGPGFVPQRFVLENFAPRGSSSLVKHCGNDYVIDPLIQFNQFQDLDLDADGALFWRHNCIQVNGETTIRDLFDATSGPYFVTGNVIMSAPGVPFPNCQIHGLEFGTYGTQGVNELSGNCNYQISGFGGYLGRLGLWPVAGGIGRLFWIDASVSFSSAEIFGAGTGPIAMQFGPNVRASYSAGGHVYVVGAGGTLASQLSFVRGSGQNAWPLPPTGGGPGPAQATCRSFADVQAAPFNGYAEDYACKSSIVPA